MIAGHLSKKSGYWYMVLQVRDNTGKTKPKWLATHLKENGNKKVAEEMLLKARMQYTKQQAFRNRTKGVYFDEYMEEWICSMKSKVRPTTFNSYCTIVRNSICPYFRDHSVALMDLQPYHIEEYYESLSQRGVCANTIIHHHANIRKALQQAVRRQQLPFNPADMVERPRKEQYIAQYYSAQESMQLLEAIHGERLEVVITLALYYGLRRSEVLGLRWGAVNFNNNTLSICYTINQTNVNGSRTIIAQEKLKRQSSFRTFPLIEYTKQLLLDLLAKESKKATPRAENFICVDEHGTLLSPEYVSKAFPQLLKKHQLRQIRFHDLRHPYVKLTLKISLFFISKYAQTLSGCLGVLICKKLSGDVEHTHCCKQKSCIFHTISI